MWSGVCEMGERGVGRSRWEGQGGGVGRAKVGGKESVWEQCRRDKSEVLGGGRGRGGRRQIWEGDVIM